MAELLRDVVNQSKQRSKQNKQTNNQRNKQTNTWITGSKTKHTFAIWIIKVVELLPFLVWLPFDMKSIMDVIA